MLDGAGRAKAGLGAEPEFVGTVDIVICATKSPSVLGTTAVEG